MKTTKKILALVLAIVMCIVATSCSQYQKATIGADGSVTMYQKTSIEKEKLESIKQKLSNKDNPFTGDVKQDETYLLMVQAFETEAKEETVDGKVYLALEETDNSYTLADLLDTYALEYENGAGEISATEMWAFTPEAYYEESGEDGDEYDDELEKYSVAMEALGINPTYTSHISFPYKITATNCQKIDDYTVAEPQEDITLYYVVTEKSEADWTKAKDIEAELKKKALEQLKPVKPKSVDVSYDTKSQFCVRWDAYKYDEDTDELVDYGNGAEIQVSVNGGKWKKPIKIGYGDMGYYSYKFKQGNTYQFRVRNLRTSPSGAFKTQYSAYKVSRKITVPYLDTCPNAKVVSNAKKTFTVSFKKPHKIKCDGYEIKYSTDKKFKKNVKTVQVARQILPVTVRELKSGKTYYVKIRKYVQAGAEYDYKIYGKWTKAFKVKVK